MEVFSNLCPSARADCATSNPTAVVAAPQGVEFKPFALEGPDDSFVHNFLLRLRISKPFWLYLCIRLTADQLDIYATSLQ